MSQNRSSQSTGESRPGKKTAASGKTGSSAGKKKTAASARKNTRKTGSTSAGGTSKRSSGKTRQSGQNSRSQNGKREYVDYALYLEIILWIIMAVSVLIFVSFFGIGGKLGKATSETVFGIFGILAYPLPFFLFFITSFLIANARSRIARIKAVSAVLLYLVLCGVCQMVLVGYSRGYKLSEYYEAGKQFHTGGGLIGGLILSGLCPFVGVIGAAIVLAFLAVILIILITQRSIFGGLRRGKDAVRAKAEHRKAERDLWEEKRREKALRRKEEKTARKDRTDPYEARTPEDTYSRYQTEGNGRNASGHPAAGTDRAGTQSGKAAYPSDAVRMEEERKFRQQQNLMDLEKLLQEKEEEDPSYFDLNEPKAMETLRGNGRSADLYDNSGGQSQKKTAPAAQGKAATGSRTGKGTAAGQPEKDSGKQQKIREEKTQAEEAAREDQGRTGKKRASEKEVQEGIRDVASQIETSAKEPKPEYRFPDIDLLNKPSGQKGGTSKEELMTKALQLQDTLETFGVKVKISNVSCGPAVTRFELIPEKGVKVAKVLALQNDIQMNLAAEEIRIEAPIPGKAAIGIEIPNDVKSSVLLRELLESDQFRKQRSRLTYAVGKDVSGRIIVSDIAKMPHLLVAGSTGSGKSVFINTLILSLLYKAKPDEVKLIMVDPKVVELSVYNGIPHLLIPVVTDPKKAAGALNWAVAEMNRRYLRFADVGVRDLKSYNQHASAASEGLSEEDQIERMPQIVIIVDELADLMMVAGSEVEEAIVRLTQLARAAGIYLVIATQRPSVDVITGLIKANMPSRIAFTVSSGVDSRTILDQVGAEKLLGQGDMLFLPQSYKQPMRIQGAFVSDDEVAEVVEQLKASNIGEAEKKNMEQQMLEMEKTIAATTVSSGVGERDELFEQAARFIIEKDKASIGMLQRMFKIGFNRAARIMDQLSEAGIVGPEEGTKPRRIEMSMEQLENYLENN